MSTESLTTDLASEELTRTPRPTEARGKQEWMEEIRAFLQTRAGQGSVLVAIAVLFCFWPLLSQLPKMWMSNDGYYSHGFLVPLIAGYVIYANRDRLGAINAKPGYFWLAILLPVLYLAAIAISFGMQLASSLCLIASIALAVGVVAGTRWMFATLLPVLYLGFCLPLWTMVINSYTNPLQLVSTKTAFALLQAFGLSPLQPDATTIYLDRFTLDVGVPCSGLKLVLALSAFTAFFMMIGRLKWWANIALVVLVLPLTIFINGLRIALIGLVGNTWGNDAGHAFHDWSGYLVLLLCFYILFKVVRILGWQR